MAQGGGLAYCWAEGGRGKGGEKGGRGVESWLAVRAERLQPLDFDSQPPASIGSQTFHTAIRFTEKHESNESCLHRGVGSSSSLLLFSSSRVLLPPLLHVHLLHPKGQPLSSNPRARALASCMLNRVPLPPTGHDPGRSERLWEGAGCGLAGGDQSAVRQQGASSPAPPEKLRSGAPHSALRRNWMRKDVEGLRVSDICFGVGAAGRWAVHLAA